MRSFLSFALAAVFFAGCSEPASSPDTTDAMAKVTFEKKEAQQEVDVLVNGKLFTAYRWPDSVYKPILYPILTANGSPITRGFPITPRQGERQDHRHQVGNWFNYGNVNGNDFWGNGSEGKRSHNGGEIKHLTIDSLSDGNGEGYLAASASWLDTTGQQLMREKTEFHFIIPDSSVRIIDRVVTLTADDKEVLFKDTKEGSFGIRVARQLELPSKESVILTDAQGNPTTVPAMSNEGVTGNYRSSEGIMGDSVWSTRAKWMDLYGSIGSEKVSVVICDHPKNFGYPTFWHARGYGLFSANPFGAKDFTNGKEVRDFKLHAHSALKMRYRIIISSGTELTNEQIEAYQNAFSKLYP